MNKDPKFEQAVSEAKEYLGRALTDAQPGDRDAMAAFVGYSKIQENWAEMVAQSAEDIDVFDQLAGGLAIKLNWGCELSKAEQSWVADVLLGKRVRPKRSGRPRKSTLEHISIVMAIYYACRNHGYLPTRNETREDHVSACDVVAEAMVRLRKQPQSFAHIKRIWAEWEHLR